MWLRDSWYNMTNVCFHSSSNRKDTNLPFLFLFNQTAHITHSSCPARWWKSDYLGYLCINAANHDLCCLQAIQCFFFHTGSSSCFVFCNKFNTINAFLLTNVESSRCSYVLSVSPKLDQASLSLPSREDYTTNTSSALAVSFLLIFHSFFLSCSSYFLPSWAMAFIKMTSSYWKYCTGNISPVWISVLL